MDKQMVLNQIKQAAYEDEMQKIAREGYASTSSGFLPKGTFTSLRTSPAIKSKPIQVGQSTVQDRTRVTMPKPIGGNLGDWKYTRD
jgi:hypothetical protein